ncbi:RNA-directed DNA polymerase, eukaryota, reverse transcriptase zinc-binding domain protein, partial [Tanacetum coccineum]
MKNLKFLKGKIREWTKVKRVNANKHKAELKEQLAEIDILVDKGEGNSEIINNRSFIFKSLQDLDNLEQQEDMECNITRKEIKRAVWDCETDKSPGPDGFTFGFYRKFWCVIENDVVEAVNTFFQNATFPIGGNASSTTLILKTHDANMVKDFRPITLIGSLYKIIAKILANCLVSVLGNIMSEVQSTFVANRQILDGSFILNELVYWCKKKNKQSMIFKVDFEKAYDSVPWDFLIDGDPLSPFLFRLVMESLHLSVQRVVDVGTKVGGLMYSIKSWDEILSKFGSRLSKWKMKTLSIGGRMTLIKSVLCSLPIYHMPIYKVPKKVINRLESIRCHFFNGIDPLSKKPIWIKWNKVLAPKDKGGLGISSFYALNRALLFKWVWRFHTQSSSLWAKVIKGIHGEDDKIGKNISNYQSSIWLDIVREMESLKYQGLLEEVLNSLNSMLYKTRRVMIEKILPSVSSKTRWLNAVPIKVNIHAWKVKLDCLPTRLNISRRGMNNDSILCPICDKEVESSNHIFFACHFAREIFTRISTWWDVPFIEMSTYEEWLLWLSNLRPRCIWSFRNKNIFGLELPKKEFIFDDI